MKNVTSRIMVDLRLCIGLSLRAPLWWRSDIRLTASDIAAERQWYCAMHSDIFACGKGYGVCDAMDKRQDTLI